MTIESKLYATLRALVSDRLFPDVAPFGTPVPYATYQQVGGTSINFIDPTVPSKRNARVQIYVWSDTRAQAALISDQVEQALRIEQTLQTTVLGQPVAVYEPETLFYGTRQDFSVWQ